MLATTNILENPKEVAAQKFQYSSPSNRKLMLFTANYSYGTIIDQTIYFIFITSLTYQCEVPKKRCEVLQKQRCSTNYLNQIGSARSRNQVLKAYWFPFPIA
jgi:hypothetical protein